VVPGRRELQLVAPLAGLSRARDRLPDSVASLIAVEVNERVAASLGELRQSPAGPVIAPPDAGYDAARRSSTRSWIDSWP
jgi:hypothetical protein